MTADLLSALAAIGQASDYPDHTYTFLACDLLTDQVIAELPLQQVQYERVLSGIGTLTAFLPLADETLPLDPITATTGGRTALYVDRDGVIVWGGIIWTRRPAPGGVTIQAAEFLSYYQHRYITQTLSTVAANVTDTDLVPNGQLLYGDQKWMMWSLFQWAALSPGGNIGIDINLLGGAADGITREATFFGYERPELFATMQQLSQADNGFDFAIEVGWNPIHNNEAPTRYRRARTYFPQRGRSAVDSGLVFSKGGPAASIVAYDWPEDWTSMATRTYALGGGDGEARLIAQGVDADLLMSGWPLLESVATYSGVTQLATLQGHANADIITRSGAAVAPTFDVLADGDPAFGTYTEGDRAIFSIAPEPRFPDGLDVELRILGVQVTAARGPEIVRLTCTGA
ncbi:hypothetical protein [Actinacidiphila sp. ITFR-21]|uniref:hypothetical protein n=1 Tax=Actinacidiphila sp. ITFR-21 TaxID=3075199 RepID=UPI00288BAC09|nr:hypothetical protein [Streptomyces sp. ITFR-21]WNI15581.1 hypothetical protein RLT57_08600 [Streptomyces sp. ITFR-21]